MKYVILGTAGIVLAMLYLKKKSSKKPLIILEKADPLAYSTEYDKPILLLPEPPSENNSFRENLDLTAKALSLPIAAGATIFVLRKYKKYINKILNKDDEQYIYTSIDPELLTETKEDIYPEEEEQKYAKALYLWKNEFLKGKNVN